MATPKLRFKEFNGDWVKTSFGKVASHISYGLTVRPEYIENGIKLISAREISTGVIDFDNAPKISKSDFMLLSDKAKPQKYDLFLSKTGSIGFTSIVETDEEFAITQNIANIRLNNLNEQDPYFFLQQMRTTSFQLKAIAVVNQSTIMDLQLGDIKKLEIGYPIKEEQTQIATFLSAVDEKISQLSQKLHLLGQYKQGMMQKLFSQQIRFKADDGSEFGEWEETKFGDIASKVGSGSTPRGGAEAYETDGIIFIRSQNVNNDQLLLNDVVYISEETHKKMSGSKVIANDILLNITGASIGRSCVVPQTFTEANVNQHVCIIRTPNDNPRFIQSFLSSKAGQDLIDSHQTGSGREGLNFQSIRSFVFQRPCLAEQIKIANFLSAIDQKIEVVAQQIEQAKQWKKGLLQQMFV